MKKNILLSLIFFFYFQQIYINAQTINGYAQVTNINARVITLGAVDEANGTFENGNDIILMQMQGNILGNTTNTANFGDISTISSTGIYEVCTILSQTETAGIPTSITVVSNLKNTYTINSNSSIQVITFPKLGNPNFTTTSNMSAKNWDGTTGGVVALQVAGTLTLAHNITANGAGFRGGNRSNNFYPGGTTCDAASFIVTSNHTNNGQKGESIYKTSNNDYLYARGKILNGGGGGNALVNGGGGGGGNYTAGGQGGRGWNATASGCSPSISGLGGMALGTYISGSRVFMGGGGGGGQQNDTQGTNGGNGGGIILLKANRVVTTGTCRINISANGNSVPNGNNDGQGGGGAGGSVVVQVASWAVVSSCPITVAANGGNGGSVNSDIHGGGGGGGQGLIMYSLAVPTANTINQTNNGVGGCDNTACTFRGSNGSGTSGSGLIGNTSTNLPITLVYFNVSPQKKDALVKWGVANQLNNQFFEIERSKDAINWAKIITLDGAGTTSQYLEYQYLDKNTLRGTSYYRLKQIDFNGEFSYSSIVAINIKDEINIYPNPAKDFVNITIDDNSKPYYIKIIDNVGKECTIKEVQKQDNILTININHLPNGIYYVQWISDATITTKKMVVMNEN